MTNLIPRNTTIPIKKAETFTTAADSQSSVDIHVLQGERQMAGDNKSIGRVILDGILTAPRGIPQVEVTFDIDANGILSVSAADKGTGKEQKIVIQSSSGLAQDEIDRMVDDAKSHEEEDQVRRAEIETRNQADTLVYTTEKMISDNSDTIPEELKEEVEGKIVILKGAIEANNLPEMQTSMTDLNDALQRLGQAVYSQASDAGMPTDMNMEDVTAPDDTEVTTDPPSDDTIEGEFREVQ